MKRKFDKDIGDDEDNDTRIWRVLCRLYCGTYSEEIFRAHFGVRPLVAQMIWCKYCCFASSPFRPSDILIVLHFLKCYQKEHVSASFFRLSKKTWEKRMWTIALFLDWAMDEIHLDDRYIPFRPTRGMFSDMSIIIDCTDCPTRRPGTKVARLAFTTGRPKDNIGSRYNIKYEVGVQIVTGKIVYNSFEGMPASRHDIRMFRENGLVYKLAEDDMLMGDKGFIGHNKIITPFKGSNLGPKRVEFNALLSSVRIMVENVIGRVKIFGLLQTKWRHEFSMHQVFFNLCCQITNISLDLEPAHLTVNNLLCCS